MSLLAKSEANGSVASCPARPGLIAAASFYREYGTVQQLLKRLNAGCLDTRFNRIERHVTPWRKIVFATHQFRISVCNSGFIFGQHLVRWVYNARLQSAGSSQPRNSIPSTGLSARRFILRPLRIGRPHDGLHRSDMDTGLSGIRRFLEKSAAAFTPFFDIALRNDAVIRRIYASPAPNILHHYKLSGCRSQLGQQACPTAQCFKRVPSGSPADSYSAKPSTAVPYRRGHVPMPE